MSTMKLGTSLLAMLVLSATSQATTEIVFDDSWADGGRDNGADPTDADWWTSTNSNAIEVSVGSLGLVSGSSGRGIRATFPDATIERGDSIKATYTFTTPDTVGDNRSTGLRAALFDKPSSGLEADLEASSSNPEPLYDGVVGYWSDFDVNTGSENVFLRERNPLDNQGRIMSTTSAYFSLGGGGDSYSFLPNTEYVGTLEVSRSGPNEAIDSVDITATLSQGGALLSSHTETNQFTLVTTFGMLGFHVNSRTFGSVNTPGSPDNGIDFSNVVVEVHRIPEPTAAVLLAWGLAVSVDRRRRT